MRLYITYGNGTHQAHNYSVIEGVDLNDCRKKAFEHTEGGKFAFSYTEEEFVLGDQIAKYRLTRIPAQAHKYLDN